MQRALQLLEVSGIVVGLVACGSHAPTAHMSARPGTAKTIRGALVHGLVTALDWGSHRQGWMMTDQLNARGYVSSVVLYHTTDTGRRWQVVVRYPKQDKTLRSVSQLVFTGTDHGMALAGLGVGMGQTKYQLLRSPNGGRNWIPVKTLWRVSGPETMDFSSASRGLIAGGTGAGTRASAMTTTDGGRHWTGVPMPGLSSAGIDYPLSATTAVFASNRDGFLVNAYWRTNAQGQPMPMLQELRTRTGGQSWNAVSLPAPRRLGMVTAVSFSSPTIGWVAVSSPKQNQTVLESTTNGGARWQEVRLRGRPLFGTQVLLARDNAWAGCVAVPTQTQRGTHLWCTSDGGTTWFAPQL